MSSSIVTTNGQRNDEISDIYDSVVTELTKRQNFEVSALVLDEKTDKSLVSFFEIKGKKSNLLIVRNHLFNQFIVSSKKTNQENFTPAILTNQNAEQVRKYVTQFIVYNT